MIPVTSASSISLNEHTSMPSVDIIARSIQNENIKEAISHLLSWLVHVKAEVVEKIYDYLNDLLPHFSIEDWKELQDNGGLLFNFLEKYPLLEKQVLLAEKMGAWSIEYVEKEKTNLPLDQTNTYSLQAMYFYSQVRRMGEGTIAEYKATASLIFRIFLQKEIFKGQLELAVRRGDP